MKKIYHINFDECRLGAMQVKQSWILTVKNMYDYYKVLEPDSNLRYENFCGLYNKYVKQQEDPDYKPKNPEPDPEPELYSKEWVRAQMREKPDKNTRKEVLDFMQRNGDL